MKKIVKYQHEFEHHTLDCPYEGEVIFQEEVAGKVFLGVLVVDENPEIPFINDCRGEFGQFNSNYIHFTPRTLFTRHELQEGRVFGIYHRNDEYSIAPELGPPAEWLLNDDDPDSDNDWFKDKFDGYYVVPEDVPTERRLSYAQGVIAQYNAFCQGEVYGYCVWEYTAATDLLNCQLEEVWGYYGREHALESLKEAFERTVTFARTGKLK